MSEEKKERIIELLRQAERCVEPPTSFAERAYGFIQQALTLLREPPPDGQAAEFVLFPDAEGGWICKRHKEERGAELTGSHCYRCLREKYVARAEQLEAAQAERDRSHRYSGFLNSCIASGEKGETYEWFCEQEQKGGG